MPDKGKQPDGFATTLHSDIGSDTPLPLVNVKLAHPKNPFQLSLMRGFCFCALHLPSFQRLHKLLNFPQVLSGFFCWGVGSGGERAILQ